MKLGSRGTRRLKKVPPDLLGFSREVRGFLLRGGECVERYLGAWGFAQSLENGNSGCQQGAYEILPNNVKRSSEVLGWICVALIPRWVISSSNAHSLAMEAGKAGSWIGLRPRLSGKQWQKDKEAGALRGWQKTDWCGKLLGVASRLLRGGEAMTDDWQRGKRRIWGLAYS